MLFKNGFVRLDAMKRKQPVLWLERKFDKHLQVWKERENVRSGRAFRT